MASFFICFLPPPDLNNMAIFSANRSLQTLVDFHSRAFVSSSRAKKRYESSRPVRYMSKDTQINNKTQDLKDSDKEKAGPIQNNASKRGRRSLKLPNFRNDGFQNELFNTGNMKTSDTFEHGEDFPEFKHPIGVPVELLEVEAGESGVLLHGTLVLTGSRTADMNEVVSCRVNEDAEIAAIELLAARAFTEVELRKKLCGKKYPLNIVESVIADIKSRGLLNDGLYAESFSRSRWLSSTWGPRRIKQALVQKGISEVEAEKATKQVFEDDEPSDGSQYLQHGMSKLSMERLLVQASKQWLRGHDISFQNRKARIVRWLQYRGFNWGVTNFILNKLESQYPQ